MTDWAGPNLFPSEIRSATLQQLRAVREDMMSAEWDLSMSAQTAAVKTAAAKKLVNVERAILALENADLAAIRDKLVENEGDLLAGTAALARARQNLAKVQEVLQAVGVLISIAAKVAKFVLVP
jgi:hypothetical protein